LSYAPTAGSLPAGQLLILTFPTRTVIAPASPASTRKHFIPAAPKALRRQKHSKGSAVSGLISGADFENRRGKRPSGDRQQFRGAMIFVERAPRRVHRRMEAWLRTLPHFRSQSSGAFADYRTTRRQ